MMNGTMTRHFITACASAFAIAVASMPAAAYAQNEDQRDFDIAAGPLAPALSRFASETGLSLVYPASLAEGRSTKGASGNVSPQAALAQLLSGTGLTFRFSDARTVVVEPLPVSGENGERVLGAVRVEGSQGASLPGATAVNGINGSRDVTATEGTGSYTSNALTIGTKTPQSIRETPMTVSVLSQQRLQDQAISDFRTALEQAPGVIAQTSGDNLAPRFYSRGFEIKTIQIDGGPGLRTYSGNGVGNTAANAGFRPQIDLALYDHIEVLRGAAGAFNSYGDPGGVVNLQRKRPLDHEQFVMELQAASYNKYRVVADATAPLAFEGKLRGRAVLTAQSNEYFYDTAHDTKKIAYGILEYDVTPTTLLTLGGSYQTADSLPWILGLMRFSDGSSLDLPRSVCLCSSTAKLDLRTSEAFVQLDQKIGRDWTLSFKGTKYIQKQNDLMSRILYRVDPVSHLGARAFTSDENAAISRQNLYEITIDGKFSAFGHEQKITAGANISREDPSGSVKYYIGSVENGVENNIPVDVFNFDPDIILPRSLGRYINVEDSGGIRSYSTAYINLDLTPINKFHILSSLRYSRYYVRNGAVSHCTPGLYGVLNCSESTLGDVVEFPSGGTVTKDNVFAWPPAVSLRYDFSDVLSAYVTYADIYEDQSDYRSEDGQPLGPMTGANYEAGVKWSPNGGRLNAALSGFYTKKTGAARCDPASTTACRTNVGDEIGDVEYAQRGFCCYVSDPNAGVESYGIDFEISGEIARNWQIFASYTYNKNRYLEGQGPLSTFSPHSLYKLWTTYRFSSESNLKGLVVGGGVVGQGSTYVVGETCAEFGDPNAFWGRRDCLTPLPFDYVDPAHAVVSANVQYDVSDKLNLALNIENLFDKKYYQTLGTIDFGNWYGSPRAFTLTARFKL